MWAYISSSPKKHSRQNLHRGCTPPSIWSLGGGLPRGAICGRCTANAAPEYSACSWVNTFLCRMQRSLNPQGFIWIIFIHHDERDIPQHLSVSSTNMKLEIPPTIPNVIALWIGTVEPQEKQCVLHHLLRFKVDAQFGIFMRQSLKIKARERSLWSLCEHNRRLRFL